MTNENPITLFPNLVQLLIASGAVITYTRGTTVFEEGDASDALYVLVEGQLKVYTSDAKGRQLVFNTIVPGEIFGELFLDGGVRSASVSALVDSSCVVIHEAHLREFTGRYPEFAHHLVHKLIYFT